MAALVRWGFLVSLLGAFVLLTLGVWPGLVGDVLFVVALFAFLWVPLVALVIASVLLWRLRRGSRTPSGATVQRRVPRWQLWATATVALATCAALWLELPLRAAFWASREAFDEALGALPDDGAEWHQRLGVYRVWDVRSDPRGGTYFRVRTGSDGIGPDVVSHGFVRGPNLDGSPYGAGGYRISRLAGDWYRFRASDDWF